MTTQQALPKGFKAGGGRARPEAPKGPGPTLLRAKPGRTIAAMGGFRDPFSKCLRESEIDALIARGLIDDHTEEPISKAQIQFVYACRRGVLIAIKDCGFYYGAEGDYPFATL